MSSFMFFESFTDAIKELPIEQQKDIIYAIARYGTMGEYPDLEDQCSIIAFNCFKPNIDASIRRSKNGKKGGRPPKVATAPIDVEIE